MCVEFRLSKMDIINEREGVCTVCGKSNVEGYYQSIHEKDCVQTFRGSDSGHKQCMIDFRMYYNYIHTSHSKRID